jgi:hypothetical protein
METRPVIVVDKLDPLRAEDDRPPAVKAIVGRPVDDLRRHPSGDARSFGRICRFKDGARGR